MKSENLSGVSSPELELENGFHEYPERPIEFVGISEGDKFCMLPSAIHMLRSLKEPVALVSIAGLSRRGKSFLLNKLLGRSRGFAVSSSSASCTDGLWLWSSPLWRIDEDGTTYNILFLDSQAIDAYAFMGAHGIQMVSLAVLLSSMFIYNQMGTIDDVALHLLSLVTERTKDIHLQATQAGDTTTMPEPRSPILLLLLRDFHLQLVEDKHLITPHAHLQHAVRRVELAGNEVETARNKMRESIRAFFPEKEYFGLVHPMIDVNDLGRLDQISIDRLSPALRDGLATLKTFILEKARPKQVGNRMMTGSIFLRITQMFLDTINNGPAPTAWKGEEEIIYLSSYSFAERIFMVSVNDMLLIKVSKGLLVEKLAYSMSVFDEDCAYTGVGNGSLREIYRMCLESGLEKKIMELAEAAAELVAHGNFANKKVGAVLGKLYGCPGSFFPRTSDPGIGSVSTHCEKLLSSGLQSRRKKFNDNFQEESIGDGKTDEEGMGFDSPCHTSAYYTPTGGVCRMTNKRIVSLMIPVEWLMDPAVGMKSENLSGPSSPELELENGFHEYPERPIEFVAISGDKFCMLPSAIHMLRSLKEPVALVSITGLSRRGKSFLLNKLLGRSRGFEVSSSSASCTDGLWLWSSPLWRIDEDGTTYNILFLDSQAL